MTAMIRDLFCTLLSFFICLFDQLVLAFSFTYIRCYQSRYDKELCSTVTAIAGLFVALLTCALVPVDIFLASFMKKDDGTFKVSFDFLAPQTLEINRCRHHSVPYPLVTRVERHGRS